MRAPDKVQMDLAYAEWQKASERLAEMRATNSTFTEVDMARQLMEAETLLQKYIELSQRFTTTLN